MMTIQPTHKLFSLAIKDSSWRLVQQLAVLVALVACIIALLLNLLGAFLALPHMPLTAKLNALVFRPLLVAALGGLVGAVIGIVFIAVETLSAEEHSIENTREAEPRESNFEATVSDEGISMPEPLVGDNSSQSTLLEDINR